jgi:site-specific recombinase XerC
MIETRSASTALNKHKALQQFFKWLVTEEEIDRSPMDRVRQPKTPKHLIPVLRTEETKRVLDTCRGAASFAELRDLAIVRVLANTGARLSEVAGLSIRDVDLDRDVVTFRGKGSKDRQVRLGPKTARALSRYLRARAKHRGGRPQRTVAGCARVGGHLGQCRQAHAATPRRAGRGVEPARSPVAAHLRRRVEAGRRRHRRPDVVARLGVGRDGAPLRRERRRPTGA